jgi:hypothetical protein
VRFIFWTTNKQAFLQNTILQLWRARRSIFYRMTTTFSPLLRSLPFATVLQICNTGQAWLCGIFAGKMIRGVGSDSALITNVENGKSTHDNSRNAGDADARNTAVKSVKRVLGSTIDIGALRHNNNPPKNAGQAAFYIMGEGSYLILLSLEFLSTSFIKTIPFFVLF